jgi:hypothetical protein
MICKGLSLLTLYVLDPTVPSPLFPCFSTIVTLVILCYVARLPDILDHSWGFMYTHENLEIVTWALPYSVYWGQLIMMSTFIFIEEVGKAMKKIWHSSVPAEIRTKHFVNTSLEHYHCSSMHSTLGLLSPVMETTVYPSIVLEASFLILAHV